MQIIKHQANIERSPKCSLSHRVLQTHLTEGVKISVSECIEFILFIFLLYFILCERIKSEAKHRNQKRGEIVCKIHI